MEKMRLGRTGLQVSRCGFGALPIQRTPLDEAVRILRKALDNGIDFYDTARAYSDSEEKLGAAFAARRDGVVIATKSAGKTKGEVLGHIETSLKNLKTDYVDILQLHNLNPLPDPNDPQSNYAGMVEARRQGKTRFISATFHSRELALKAADSGLYDTIQFPLSSLSSEADLTVIEACRRNDLGLIAMKAISGGLITNIASAFAFLRQYDNVVPIWGVQRESELDEFLRLEADPPVLDDALWAVIAKDRKELAGKFCRGCGYCMPCPAGINIPWTARMSLLLRRAPYQNFLTDEWKKNMAQIKACIDCGACRKKCPYGLDTPNLLKENLSDYESFVAAQV